jgi:hypothetical protein
MLLKWSKVLDPQPESHYVLYHLIALQSNLDIHDEL